MTVKRNVWAIAIFISLGLWVVMAFTVIGFLKLIGVL